MADVISTIGEGFKQSFLMAYEVWWALVLGFAISAIVQAWVPARAGRVGPLRAAASGRSPGRPASGAASSSCSYAAIAIAKSLFQKGASAATSLAFQFASTNLVWELGLVIWILLGWQFTLAEFVGGFILIALMAILLRAFVSPKLEEQAREHAQQAQADHQHHAVGEQMGWRERLTSVRAWSDVAHNFRADWTMLWKEITIGFLLAGFIGLLGDDFFNALFIRTPPPACRLIENVIVGPIIAVLSFVCSVGNAPLAAVLWSGGIGFAGVIAFIFADLIVLPIVAAYIKYYGREFALRITALMFVTIVVAALLVDGVFGAGRADPGHPPVAGGHLRLGRARLQAGPQRPRPGDLRGALLSDRSPRGDRPGLRDEGGPHQGAPRRARRAHLLLLLGGLPLAVPGRSRRVHAKGAAPPRRTCTMPTERRLPAGASLPGPHPDL